jgi:ATP-dependent RNA circularization protein (DNA/RNA ligase family)
MEQFNKVIMVGTESKWFQFKKMKNTEGIKFFITTVDEKQKPLSFSMKKNIKGEWALTSGFLRWLYDIQTAPTDAIMETQPL